MQTLLLMWVLADISPPRFELDGNSVKVPGPVYFETGNDKLKPESDPTLAHIQAYLTAKSYITLLRIEVHSDSRGVSAYNQLLTEKRALAVARALVSRGIACQRLIAVGFGETKPVAPNSTEAGRSQNRRTVFVNAALNGKPIGGQPVDGGGKVAGDVCN